MIEIKQYSPSIQVQQISPTETETESNIGQSSRCIEKKKGSTKLPLCVGLGKGQTKGKIMRRYHSATKNTTRIIY